MQVKISSTARPAMILLYSTHLFQNITMTAASPLRQPLFLALAFLLGLSILLIYGNYFNNPFHFDDTHTIAQNTAIRDLNNTWRFFSDAGTFSTNPSNQAWRPLLTLINAIDTHLSGGTPKPTAFHIHNLVVFLLLLGLIFLLFHSILQQTFTQSRDVHWFALGGTGLFALHTANAETINYIIARSDLFSTLYVVASLVIYIYYPRLRNYYLFVLIMIVGLMIKETTLMLAPLLGVYLFIFPPEGQNSKTSIKHTIIAFTGAIIMYLISRWMTPGTWNSGGGDPLSYFATQMYVIVHYMFSFILPIGLSVDTDWTLAENIFDWKVIGGLFINLICVWGAWRLLKQTSTKPIAFGILWFFIALAPTSSFFPFAEVLNDHRTFFPYIGLVLIFTTCALLFWEKYKTTTSAFYIRYGLIVGTILLLSGHAIGTLQRNETWSSEEKLWKDATIKSPDNGRAWMNYGLTQLAKGDYIDAEKLFATSLELNPDYSYAHINMAIALRYQNRFEEADSHFKKALNLRPDDAESYVYYSRFLSDMGRTVEAAKLIQKGLEISPHHEALQQVKLSLIQPKTADDWVGMSLQYYNIGNYNGCINAAYEALKLNPNYTNAWINICAAHNKIGEWTFAIEAGRKAVKLDPKNELAQNNLKQAEFQLTYFDSLNSVVKKSPTLNNWITLTLAWYNVNNFKICSTVAEETVQRFPQSELAWNNLCAVYNQLKDWDKAIIAGKKAVELKPGWDLAKNNLTVAQTGKANEAAGNE